MSECVCTAHGKSEKKGELNACEIFFFVCIQYTVDVRASVSAIHIICICARCGMRIGQSNAE